MRILRKSNSCNHSGDGVEKSQGIIAVLRELRSSGLLGHDVCNILVRLDVRKHDNFALHALLKKSNFDSHVFYCFVRKIVPKATAIAAVLSIHTEVLLIIVSFSYLHCNSNNSTRMCLTFTTSLASAIVSGIAVHRATVVCLPE